MQPVRIAAFDYDDTIISGQSGALIGLYLYRRHLLPYRVVLQLLGWGARYKLHLPHDQARARELVFTRLKTFDPNDVRVLMEDFHNQVLVPRVRADACNEIERRRQEGCYLLIVSASFSGVIKPACRYLDMDGYVATSMEVDGNGRYTGRVRGTVTEGMEKNAAIRRFADERFGKGGWELAYAYGDHHSDWPMLAAAKRAFAVDADTKLKRMAQLRGWDALEWK